MDNYTPRRPKQVIADEHDVLALLDQTAVGYLGLSKEGEPYVLPVNYARVGRTIYIHSSPTGKKIEFIRVNPQACLAAVPLAEYLKGECNYRYRSAIAYGRARVVTDGDELYAGYRALLAKYEPDGTYQLSDECVGRSVIIALDIEKITGKTGPQGV
ncbi:MAG: pyridoxamine 5'-phosphate oxidase family protein [Bacillota bacterium]